MQRLRWNFVMVKSDYDVNKWKRDFLRISGNYTKRIYDERKEFISTKLGVVGNYFKNQIKIIVSALKIVKISLSLQHPMRVFWTRFRGHTITDIEFVYSRFSPSTGVFSDDGGMLSFTTNNKTEKARRTVMLRDILSEESGGSQYTWNASAVAAIYTLSQ